MTGLFALALVVATLAAVRGMWSPCGLSMLSSLNPVAEASRGNRYSWTAAWYLAGAAAGGAALGAGCAVAAFGLGRLGPAATWLWSIALGGALVALLSDAALTRFALPVHARQVDERWLTTYRRWIYAGGYGLQIGAGFATYIMTAAVYLTAWLAILTASPREAFVVGLTFGVARGLCVLTTVRVRSPERLRALVGRIDASAAMSMQVVRAGEAAVAVAAGWFAGGPALGGVLLAVAAAVPAGEPVRRRVRATA